MIKLRLQNEVPPPVEKEVIMDLRQHKAALNSPYRESHPDRHTYYVVMNERVHSAVLGDQYPIKIDGLNKRVTIRKSCLEKLGFEVRIE